jgi:tRNA (guanine-N7-)-methyltransferase
LTDFAALFGNGRPLTVEIGFGMGRATADIAEANPERNYLGIEVFRAGVGRLVWEIEKRRLSNIRIIEHDAVEALETMVPPGSVSAFHLFFPDPWPKKRHHKRRLVQMPFAELLASRLAEGGYVLMVTDWENYAEEALAVFSAVPGLSNPHGGFAPPAPWRPSTRFEAKGRERGRPIREIYMVKRTEGSTPPPFPRIVYDRAKKPLCPKSYR